MIDYPVMLDYQLAAGWMSDYLAALAKGQAVGRMCDDCRKVSFPPERVCSCKCVNGSWQPLSGMADIEWRCDGLDGSFGLVHFHGADSRSLAILHEIPEADNCGQLIPATGNLPAICLGQAEGGQR